MEPRTFILKARLGETRKGVVPAISATELGRRLMQSLPGFKPAYVSALELGYRYATWSEVEALAKVLNVDPYWLANRPRPALVVPRAPKVIEPAKVVTKHKSARPSFVVRPTVPVAPPPPASSPSAPPDLAPTDLVLVPGDETEFRRQLLAELERTTLKLHDDKLKAFEWRSWREYEKRIRAAAAGRVVLPE